MIEKGFFMSKFWVPDIYFYHVRKVENWGKHDFVDHVRIKDGSRITMGGSVFIKQNCKFGFNWYPFDYQTCIVAVGSNWFTEDMVNFTGSYRGPSDKSWSLLYHNVVLE